MMFVDGSYVGRRAQMIHQQRSLMVEVMSHSTNANVGRWCFPSRIRAVYLHFGQMPSFMALPKRWVVERTYAWIKKHADW